MTAAASKNLTPCLIDPTLTSNVSMKNQAKNTLMIANLLELSNSPAAAMIRAGKLRGVPMSLSVPMSLGVAMSLVVAVSRGVAVSSGVATSLGLCVPRGTPKLLGFSMGIRPLLITE